MFTAIAMAALCTIAGFVRLKQGYRPARLYVAGLLIFAVGVTTYNLTLMDILPHNSITSNGYVIGSVFEMLLFSLALSDRITFFAKEKKKALLEAEKSRYKTQLFLEKNTNAQSRYAEKLKKAIENTQKEVAEKNTLIIEDLKQAQWIQNSSLPSQALMSSLLDQCVVYRKPKDLVGTEMYAVNPIEDGLFYLSLFDCGGHGVGGAIFAQSVQANLNAIFKEIEASAPPSLIIEALDRRLSLDRNLKDVSYQESLYHCEIAVCRVDRNQGVLSFSGLGLGLFCQTKGDTHYYQGTPGFVGDWRRKSLIGLENMILSLKNSAFFMVSDGVTGQIGGDRGLPFGRNRLTGLLKDISGTEIDVQIRKMEKVLRELQGDQEQSDDISIIGFSA